MIDHDLPADSDESANPLDMTDEISKSQRKRDAHAVRELGQRLAELGASELATIPLPEDVLAEIHELNRLKANSAKKRQLGLLAKRMRQIDVQPIEDALERLRQAARANTRSLHLIEQWRDRILGESPDETEKQALTEFLHQYSHADRQHFRHLQRQAIQERKAQKPPAAARQLFKAIRDVVLPAQEAVLPTQSDE